jgi:plasmid replication initiation protein
MANLVSYKNELNTVPLRKFNSKEMDLFFSICSKMKNQNLETITFEFEELRELSDYKITSTKHFVSDLESIYSKLIKLDFRIGTATEFTKFVLFTQYSVSAKDQIIKIKTNKDFNYILNNIAGNFTKFELEEFTMLGSSYSKTAYRLLKQFRKTGYYIIKIDEFRRLFSVPASYKMSDITKNILDKIKKELPPYFKNLRINKLKGKGRRKRFIDYIEFKFEAETDIKDGVKIFRNEETQEYYQKNIMDFNAQEIKKAFPEIKNL